MSDSKKLANNKDLLSEDPSWWNICALPQVAQDDPKWLAARANKQSSSDFGAVVPRTEEYIGHIMDMWKHTKPEEYDAEKTCYDISRTEYFRKKCAPFASSCDVCEENGSFPAGSSGSSGGAAAQGNRFEPLVRNATSQLLRCIISEVGWVEELRYPHAGVSPDGVAHMYAKGGAPQPFEYAYGLPDIPVEDDATAAASYRANVPQHIPTNRPAFAIAGAKNFEAKTIVSREMERKVPLKYHIQVERTAFELHLKSSMYTEAKFLELYELDWKDMSKDEPIVSEIGEHLKYGIILQLSQKGTDDQWSDWKDIPPHGFVVTPTESLKWRDDTVAALQTEHGIENVKFDSIYFKLEALWCVEIPVRKDYAEVYGPLIEREAARVHRLSMTEEGRAEYIKMYAPAPANENAVVGEGTTSRRKYVKKCMLFTEDMSQMEAIES